MAAILLSNFVWEGTSTEMTDILPDISDGQVYKQLDTGESYIRRDGIWQYINLGLAFVKATKSGRVTTDASGEAQIVFNTPFIADDYSVALSCNDQGGPPYAAPIAFKTDRTPGGFRIVTRRPNGQPFGNVEVSWLATRDYNP